MNDSRDECNALIKTDTNTLVLGTGNTKIPSSIKVIGFRTFSENIELKELVIPEGIEEIQSRAFENCKNIKNVVIPESVINIDFSNYGTVKNPFYGCLNLTLWIHKNSYAEKCAKEQNINYKSIEVNVTSNKKVYKPFECVDINNTKIFVNYEDGKQETISDGIKIRYTDKNSSFRGDDTFYIISGYNKEGVYIEKRVEIKINKFIPQYTIPKDIQAMNGMKLSEVKLPKGFKWMDENQVIEYSENAVYKARYIPEDEINYEIVENIEIPIKVEKNAKVEYEYNEETNQVIAKIVSNIELKDTEPTWKLSEDKKSYIKLFTENQKYSTTVQNINGEIYEVDIVINQIQKTKIEVQEIYNEDENEVIIQLISNVELKNTKPTWQLSTDKKTYTKKFTSNMGYNTLLEDKWGNAINTYVEITRVKDLKIKVEYEHIGKTNQVKAKIISNVKLKDTKPTWNLSEDQKVYTKLYNENSKYNTRVESINGEIQNVELDIKDVDDKGPEITIDYRYNNIDNTVTVYMKSNEKLGNTKPTWKLDEEQIIYEKVYSTEKEDYSTKVQDIYGNTTEVRIKFNKRRENVIDGENNIDIVYLYTSNNNVEVQVISDNEFQNTKPTWTLSEDKHSYSKVYEDNGTYTTAFLDLNGKVENIKFDIIEIDNEGPQIKIETKYDEKTNTVTVEAVSNEILGQTKPTWALSEDKLMYSKKYNVNGTYTTIFSDQYGNTSKVTFKISEIK